MKFGKSLSTQIEETLPEWRDKFLLYKELKKRIKLIDSNPNSNGDKRPQKRLRSDTSCTDSPSSSSKPNDKYETDFVRFIHSEIDKFNLFFVDKEEEYVIKLKELQDRFVKATESNGELIMVQKEIVDFHGEMILLENYSALNYTGLVKILKKYEKQTGALIRQPFIQNVLNEPFYSTDLLSQLVKACETMLDQLFPTLKPSVSSGVGNGDEGANTEAIDANNNNNKEALLSGPKELEEIEHMESLYVKSTLSALRILKEIRSKSSTVGPFSLPPLQTSGMEETWKKAPVLEQEAK